MDRRFSPTNLRKIWDSQTRKGKDLLDFYPEVNRAYATLRQARNDARASTARNVDPDGASHNALNVQVNDLKRVAESTLTEALTRTSQDLIADVEAGKFTWGLHPTKSKSGRQFFGVGTHPSAYFADKQLQRILGSQLALRPSSRQTIISALCRTLENDLPKHMVRVDVHAFYDTIDHAILKDKLGATRLAPTSRRLISLLLDQMALMTGVDRGLPMGVGLSAKLAEYYLADVDLMFRNGANVLYYARYVDDIVVVHGKGRNVENTPSVVLNSIASELDTLKLRLSPTKQETRELNNNNELAQFEFLGYAISYKAQRVRVELTHARHKVLRTRIDRTFEAWDRSDHSNHGRRKLLLQRLRFLAGNTRLSHNKRQAMVGIYFSNPHVSDAKQLEGLIATFGRERLNQIFRMKFGSR